MSSSSKKKNHPSRVRTLKPTSVASPVQISRVYSGPLPPPEILRQYDEILPGSASAIIQAYQSQVKHRLNVEQQQVDSDITHRQAMSDLEKERINGIFRSDLMGQLCGFVLALVSLGAAIYFATVEAYVAMGFFLSFPVMGMIRQFIKSQK